MKYTGLHSECEWNINFANKGRLLPSHTGKEPTKQETPVQSPGREDPLEEKMATHTSILAWRISWAEEPGGLQFTGSQRAGHDLATKQQQQNI